MNPGANRPGSPLVPAAALGYAITFLFLVGMVCSGVLIISSVNKRLETNYTIREHLVFDNYLSLLLGARLDNETARSIVHTAGDTSAIQVKSWGAYKVVVAKTFHGNRRISRSALIGYNSETTLPALYLPENSQALKLTGNTRIEGIAYLSERGLDRGYIAGKNYENDQLIYGEQRKSDNSLPKLHTLFENLSLESLIAGTVKIDPIGKDSTFAFDQPTALISTIGPLYLRNRLAGNIILHSFDSIYVSAESVLENVILIAPKIRFQKNFRGSVQAIAHESIVCEENVRLTYPSTLVMNETAPALSQNRLIQLHEKAQVLGGILLVSQQSNFRMPVQLQLREKSLVAGLVYNQGETELRGKVIGHLYTQRFFLRAGGGEYINHLLDAVISSKQLPDEFIIPGWLATASETSKSRILTCF